MRFTQADLIFVTDHAFRLFTTYFRFVDLERLAFSWINSCAYSSYHHFLPYSHIRCTANDLQFSSCSGIYFGYFQSVSIWVLMAFFDIANHEAVQSTGYSLYFLQGFHLEPNSG